MRTRIQSLTGGLGLLLLTLACDAGEAGGERTVDSSRETGPVTLAQVDEQVEPAARPEQRVEFEQGCATAECHSRHLESTSVHGPIASERCDVCHAADTGEHVFDVLEGLNDECLRCHDIDPSGPLRHGLGTDSNCLGCHDPHGSDTPFLLRKETVAKTCQDCHAQTLGLVRHAPYKDGLCMTCHEPHQSQNPFFLYEESDKDHCRKCHEPMVAAAEPLRISHFGVEGGCFACHTAHASDHAQLLTQSPGELCLSCHEDIATSIDGAIVAHEAVLNGERCLACHDPHASDQPHMLLGDQTGLCLECHGDSIIARDGHRIPDMTAELTQREFIHGPVRAGECTACHGVHGAGGEHLLMQSISNATGGVFERGHNAVCFECHTRDLVREERTTSATAFRDGDRNLHSLHANSGPGGEACSNCHAVHGSRQAHDIADRVPFDGSDWLMRIGYELTESGGTCTSACHELLEYSREAPRATPELEDPR